MPFCTLQYNFGHNPELSKLDRTIRKLSADPGTAWLGQLYDDARISPVWTEITARHDRWHKKQEGLTGAAAALIAVAVAVATGGVGAGLIGAAGAGGAMASAGFSALASTAAVSVVNNQGNIGRVFKDLASKDSLKKLAVSVITAGMLSSAGLMGGAADGAKSSVQEVVQERANQSLFNLETLTHHLKCNLVRGGVQAAADLVTGDKVDGLDLLKNAATNTIVDALGEHLAGEIGQDYKVGKINPLQHKLLHAGVGGFAGALMNPADPLHGAASGALSALVAETAADHLMGQTAASTMARYLEDCRRTGEVPTENGYYNQMVNAVAEHPDMQMMVPSSDHARAKERVAMIAKIAGAAGAFLAGLDPNIAFRAAENAIENNFLLPVFLRNNDPAMLADSEEWMAEHIKNQAETEEMMAAVGEVALEVGLAGLQKVPIVGPIVGATKGFLKKGAGAARMAAKSAAKKAAGNPAVQVKSTAKPVKKEQPEVVKYHGNSRKYVGETHVYGIRNKKTGEVHKIGESMQGVTKEGVSKRAKTQARRLEKETGERYETKIRKTFKTKDEARTHETNLIERYRSLYGKDKLPGNKGNR